MSSELHARHWIDGEWVDAKDLAESVNPATGETIGSYTEATEAEAKRAIGAALKARDLTLRSRASAKRPKRAKLRTLRNRAELKKRELSSWTLQSSAWETSDPEWPGA